MSDYELLCLYVLEFIGCFGCKIDFFYLYLFFVGEVCKLLVDVEFVEISDLVYSLVCVFDDDGYVVGFWNLQFSNE